MKGIGSGLRSLRQPQTDEEIRCYILERVVVDEPGCWIWQRATTASGYGQFWANNTRVSAHRESFRVFVQDFDEALHVCHRCDNPSCCNPAHLFIGTRSDNMQDASTKDRIAWGERHGNSKLSKSDVLEIRRIRSLGLSQAEIAARFGVLQPTIGRILRGESRGRDVTIHGWRSVVNVSGEARTKRHERHHKAKLTMEKARTIRQMYSDGLTYKAIAGHFGVSIGAVSHIINGRHWRETVEGVNLRATNAQGHTSEFMHDVVTRNE